MKIPGTINVEFVYKKNVYEVDTCHNILIYNPIKMYSIDVGNASWLFLHSALTNIGLFVKCWQTDDVMWKFLCENVL